MDAGNGSHLRTLTGHTGWVWDISFSPNGATLASGSLDRTLCTATLTLANTEGEEKIEVELYEYANDNDEDMSIELCSDSLTFYVGVLITRSDIEIYLRMEAQPERK